MVDINVSKGVVARTIQKGENYKVQLCKYDSSIPEQCAVLFMLGYTLSTTDENIYYVPESTYMVLQNLKFETWMDCSKYERSCEGGIYNVWESAIEGVKNLVQNKDIRNSRTLYLHEVDPETTEENIIWKDILTPDGKTERRAYISVQDSDPIALELREHTIAAFRKKG